MEEGSTRVLLVGDHADELSSLGAMLEPSYTHERVRCLTDALDRVEAGDVGVVLLNLGLPDSRGLETLARMRARAPHVPVVVLTGQDDHALAVPALQAGAQDHLPRGHLDRDMLQRSLRHAIERARAQTALADSQETLRRIFDESSAGFVMTDPDGTILQWSRAMERITGLSSEQALGKKTWQLHADLIADTGSTPRSFDELAAIHRARLDAGMPPLPAEDALHTIERPDGERRVLRATGFPLGTCEGLAAGAIIHDVTERHHARAALRHERMRAQQYLDLVPVMVIALDLGGTVTLANAHAAQILGHDEAELVGKDWFETFLSPRERDEAETVFRRLMVDNPEQGESCRHHVRTRTGEERLVAWSNVLLRDERGEVCGMLGAGEDITEAERLQRRLASADRLASVGRLASGIAHEINNPLAYVLGNLEYLAEHLPPVLAAAKSARVSPGRKESAVDAAGLDPAAIDDLLACVHDSIGGTRRIRKVALDLDAFSRSDAGKHEPVHVNEVVDSALKVAHNQMRFRARVVRDFGAVPPVLADEARLSQALVNLLINAAQAIPEGDVGGNEIRVRTTADDLHVLVEVSDTGIGIPESELQRVFDAYGTGPSQGTSAGLGLSICHSVVVGFGGSIEVHSRVGKGSVFTVRLPAYAVAQAAAPVQRAGPEQDARQAPRRGRRLLVVDDEPMIGRSVRRALGEHYDVVLARSGAEARQVIEQGGPFDLLLCDLIMPEVSGMELYDWLQQNRPDLVERVIFISGGAFTERSRTFLEGVSNLCLHKPVDLRQLRAIVRDRLGEGPAPAPY